VVTKIVKSTCLGCISSCGVICEVEDNRIVKMKGDPEHRLTRGYICPRGSATEEIRSHPERLRYPLRRAGNKGEGKWKRISWDEAIDEIAGRLSEVKAKYGAESFVLNIGFVGVLSGLDPDIGRFLHLFGSPNRFVVLHICAMPAHVAGIYTCGFSLLSGVDFRNSRCIMIWGADMDVAWRGLYHADIQEAVRGGAKLIVIDPRQTPLAAKADEWLQVRPGTDCALALGMLNVIINEGLYDREFVEKWTFGFDRLRQHVQQYPPQRVAEITWVPEASIRQAARLYAQNRPACIGSGAGGVTHNTNAFQAHRAISLLPAITGNLDVPGGHVSYIPLLRERGTMAAQYDRPFGKLSAEQIGKRLGVGAFGVLMHQGYFIAHPSGVWPAITEGKPYPVKAMLGIAANPVVSAEDAKIVREALLKLDFFAVSDLFMTPTAEVADIVLPAAHWSERDEIVDAYTRNYIFCHRKIVDPPEECREDKEILIELAKKLGMEEYWKSVEESLDYRLARVGITLEEFKERGMVEGPVEYRKHERFGGFRTGSSKVDLYSETLEKLGYDPIPVHREPPESPLSTPELAREYPLILVTGVKELAYFHSAYRNIPTLHRMSPEPLVEIHPDTAKELDIEEGDWVQIETPRGSIKHKAKLSNGIHPKVVVTPHGWWYGYKDGWKEVNVNILTGGEHYDPQVGSAALKGVLCHLKKAESPPS